MKRKKRSAPEDTPLLEQIRAIQDEALTERKRAADEAEAKERRQLETDIPPPPPIKANEDSELVAAIETKIVDLVRATPTCSAVIISLTRKTSVGYGAIVELPRLVDGSTWWAKVCLWAERCVIRNPSGAIRFRDLVSACIGCVLGAWNAAHPELEAKLEHVDVGNLHFAFPAR